jgi:hypothetical protein
MYLADTLTLDAPKRTKDGFLAVRARAARAGVYDYAAFEVGGQERGFKATDTVKVYRPAEEVFAADSVASFLAKPVTNDHPNVPVTSENWKDHARGVNMGALRDGEYLAFDLVIMDGALIADIDAGKRELSNGYACVLDWTPGTTPDGQAYDAVQRQIRGNHIAVVDRGRAGPDCRIKDSDGGKPFAACDANPAAISGLSMGETRMKIMLDGLHVDLTDADAVKAAFDKVKGDAEKAIADSAKELTDAKANADKALAAKDAEIESLKSQVVDQAAIDALADAKAALVAKGKELLGDKMPEAKGKSVADLRKAIVVAAIGDEMADKSDAYIEARFDALDAAKPADKNVVAIAHPQIKDAGAAVQTARKAWLADKANAHRRAATAA